MLLLYQCLCLGGRMLSVCKGKGLFTVCRCRCVGLRGMHVGLAGWNGDAGENVTIRRLCILVEVAFVSSGWCALWGPRPTATVFATMETFVGELCNASVASRVDLCIECVADVCFVRRCNAVVMLPCLLFPCTWVTC